MTKIILLDKETKKRKLIKEIKNSFKNKETLILCHSEKEYNIRVENENIKR